MLNLSLGIEWFICCYSLMCVLVGFTLFILQEQVQLNVALQTEIVRFTVLGIQKAIQEVEETMAEQERLSANGGPAASFFVSS